MSTNGETATRQLEADCQRFFDEPDPASKDEAGRDLMRTVFGEDSIAEEPLENTEVPT